MLLFKFLFSYSPAIPDIVPLKPSKAPLFITILIMPPTPSGSYFADGFVMTSTFSTIPTLILSTTPRLFEPVIPERFPSIKIVTFASPAIETSPSIFTSRVGTFLRRSNPVPPAAVRFFPTLKICLSTV